MDETTLIQKAKLGDIAAYNQLVLTYQQDVYNVTYRIMHAPQAAEDVTQETFIAAYKALGSFRDGNFKAWLLRIGTNRCYDALRRHKRRPQSSLDELTEQNDAPAFLSSPDDGPEEQQEQSEVNDAIAVCLKELPDDQRIVAVLCDVEGYSYDEIAEIVSVSLGTVKSRLNRARSKLRDCLQRFRELLPSRYRS
jgi:RNA polymerase sigma-70 factor (ECF subfamily)